MPLLKRKPVDPAPEVDLDSLPEDEQLFYLEKTGEVFTTYQSVSLALPTRPPLARLPACTSPSAFARKATRARARLTRMI